MDWDEMLNFNKTTKEQMEEGAEAIYELYSSFIRAGFKDEQALEITISFLDSIFNLIKEDV